MDRPPTFPFPTSPFAPQYRHVVFRDVLSRRRGVLNLSATRPSPAPPEKSNLSDDEEAFLRWLFAEAGLDIRNYRLRTLKRRIPACLRALGAASFDEARRALGRKDSLIVPALSTLVIGVTSFFRDAGVFQTLQTQIVPELLSGRYGLAVWSIGCSDGPELYSLAMMLAEFDVLDRCHLLGTDCRADAVRRARNGLFETPALRGLSEERVARFFVRQGPQWHAAAALRDVLHWRKADILSLHEPGVWDMIACRNMSMYMSPEATAALWPRLESSLRPGGYLVLGKAERPTTARHLSLVSPCIYRRNRG